MVVVKNMITQKKKVHFSSNVETTRHIPHTYIRLLQLGNMFKIPSHLQKACIWVLKVLLRFANASKRQNILMTRDHHGATMSFKHNILHLNIQVSKLINNNLSITLSLCTHSKTKMVDVCNPINKETTMQAIPKMTIIESLKATIQQTQLHAMMWSLKKNCDGKIGAIELGSDLNDDIPLVEIVPNPQTLQICSINLTKLVLMLSKCLNYGKANNSTNLCVTMAS